MIKRLLTIILCFTLCMSLTSCDILELVDSFTNSKINIITNSNFIKSESQYDAIDSFTADDGRYYYFYYLGVFDTVPINIMDCDGVYFDGKNMELTFNFSHTNTEHSATTLNKMVENSLSLSTTTYSKGSLSAEMYSIFDARIEAGIEQNATASVTTTFTDTIYNAVTTETHFEKTLKYRMDKKDPVGYYFYTTIASMKVYEVVVYNPQTKCVEYMTTYNQLGPALPGLFYSPLSFIDSGAYEIDFDEAQLEEFKKPNRTMVSDISVSIDAKGGTCDAQALNVTLGKKFGTLPPNPKRHGYTFKGWTCDGKIVTPESMVTSNKPIEATWDIVTSITIPMNQTISVNHSTKLNPFFVVLPDLPGESGESATAGINIFDYFDFEELSRQGYAMKIKIDYYASRDKKAVFGAEYKIVFRSNGREIYTFSNETNSTSGEHKTEQSPLINLEAVSGSVNFNVTTENIFNVHIKDLNITFTFQK